MRQYVWNVLRMKEKVLNMDFLPRKLISPLSIQTAFVGRALVRSFQESGVGEGLPKTGQEMRDAAAARSEIGTDCDVENGASFHVRDTPPFHPYAN